MIEFYLVMVIVLFIAGVATGILALVVFGIHREERSRGVPTRSPGRAASGARIVTGLHVFPRGTYEAVQYRHRQPPHNPDW
jgi:hypothetical protein